MKDAETWLRFGLDQFPRDPQMMVLAAKFETARGDPQRAAEYYRAALKIMPRSDAESVLATEFEPGSSDRAGGAAQLAPAAGALRSIGAAGRSNGQRKAGSRPRSPTCRAI